MTVGTMTLQRFNGAEIFSVGSASVAYLTDEEDRYVITNFYYFEHEVMDDIEINVVKRHMDHAQLCITGTTTDVNYYDGSKPATRVLIDAEFTLKFAQE
jgi:hypothetical protein